MLWNDEQQSQVIYFDITEREKGKIEIEKLMHELAERVKELNCLYIIPNVNEKPGITIEEIIEETVSFLSSGWQYPEITCNKIVFDGREFKTDNFMETKWKQSADIVVQEEIAGEVVVCYLEEKPEADEGPFLKQEKSLIEVIALRLGEIIENLNVKNDLEKSEERFRQVTESAGEMLWEVDLKGVYTYISPLSVSLIGYHPEEIILKKHFYDLFTPDLKEKIKNAAFEVFARKEPFNGFENPNLHKDGHTVIFETSGFPILDDNGHLVGYRGADKDVTRRKKVEDKLANNLKELRRWHNAMLGREERVLELKKEVNDLLIQTGKAVRYTSIESVESELK